MPLNRCRVPDGKGVVTFLPPFLPPAFTVQTLADRWSCSQGLVRKLIGQGDLQVFTIGKLIRIPASEVEKIECQNIPYNGSEAASHWSGKKIADAGVAERSMQPIGRARRPRLGISGRGAINPLGP